MKASGERGHLRVHDRRLRQVRAHVEGGGACSADRLPSAALTC